MKTYQQVKRFYRESPLAPHYGLTAFMHVTQRWACFYSVGCTIVGQHFGVAVYRNFHNNYHNIVLISLGEQNVKIDMDKQRVYVTSTLSADELLETIKKAGKTCSYIGVA